jgi:hypothetical protein
MRYTNRQGLVKDIDLSTNQTLGILSRLLSCDIAQDVGFTDSGLGRNGQKLEIRTMFRTTKQILYCGLGV